MKKIKITSVLVSMVLLGNAQMNWNTGLNNFSGGGSPNFGTSSNHPIKFVTAGSQKMSLGTDGTLKIDGLAGEGYRALAVDALGVIGVLPPLPPPTNNCNTIIPWYVGGNKNLGVDNTIGTCEGRDFILKANSTNLMFITSATARIGIGPHNSAPLSMLDVSDGALHTSPSTYDHTRIYGDAYGTIESTGPITLISSDWLSFRVGTMSSSTQQFLVNDQGHAFMGDATMANATMANANITGAAKINAGTSGYAFSVNNASAGDVQAIWTDGKASFGKISSSVNQAQLNVNVTTSNANAIDVYDITSGKVNFRVLSSGKTRVGDQPSSPNSAQLNVNVNGPSLNAIAVWDQAANSGAGDHNFVVKSNGYTYCRELQVMTGSFPDYVFDKAYKLKTLGETEAYINANKHLPGFESAEYYIQNGIKTSEMFVKQQEKIEELTLYIIELEKRLQDLEKRK